MVVRDTDVDFLYVLDGSGEPTAIEFAIKASKKERVGRTRSSFLFSFSYFKGEGF